jgi:hypothetical protein
VKVVVLNLKSLLKVTESRPQFLCLSEDASEIVVGYSSNLVRIFCEGFSFLKEFEGNIEVF